MSNNNSADQAAGRVKRALDRMVRDTPALRDILAAFGPLLTAQAELKDQLPALDVALPRINGDRLAQGEPLAGVADFLEMPGLDLSGYLVRAGKYILPAMASGFPALAPGCEKLGEALADGYGPSMMGAFLAGEGEALEALEGLAGRTGLDASSLGFVLMELARPLLEKRAQALGALLPGHSWHQGYCPVCGSLPALSYLQGAAGQRWLRCSLCAHHWRFKRTACPVCGNQDQEKMDFFFVAGREHERVEACHECGQYLLSLDARELAEPPVWEVAALGLIHLDLMAQERGLSPAARTVWNQVR